MRWRLEAAALGRTLGSYSTYLGTPDGAIGVGIARGRHGFVYVTGLSHSFSFPTAIGGFDTTYNGGSMDAFVTKLCARDSGDCGTDADDEEDDD